jgi:hypothetical protein
VHDCGRTSGSKQIDPKRYSQYDFRLVRIGLAICPRLNFRRLIAGASCRGKTAVFFLGPELQHNRGGRVELTCLSRRVS